MLDRRCPPASSSCGPEPSPKKHSPPNARRQPPPKPPVRRGTPFPTSPASPTGTGPASRRCGWGAPSSCGAWARACQPSTASKVGVGGGRRARFARTRARAVVMVGALGCGSVSRPESGGRLARQGLPAGGRVCCACAQPTLKERQPATPAHRPTRGPLSKPNRQNQPPGDLRLELYADVASFVAALRGRDYLGGSAPNLADLSMFGVLRAVAGTPAYNDIILHTKARGGGVC